MFRLFLKKKLFTGQSRVTTGRVKPPQPRNRRLFERYPVDYKHLTLLNEQDILVVRDISAKGFSTTVSQRGYDRFALNDIYLARMRYLGEVYDLEIRVSWKDSGVVGFEIEHAAKQTLKFMQRLLRPIEIATSLNPVDANFMTDNQDGKLWFHGDYETDLYIWRDQHSRLSAWQLIMQSDYVEWSETTGLTTGTLLSPPNQQQATKVSVTAPQQRTDPICNPMKKQLATDIICAMKDPVRLELIPTIVG